MRQRRKLVEPEEAVIVPTNSVGTKRIFPELDRRTSAGRKLKLPAPEKPSAFEPPRWRAMLTEIAAVEPETVVAVEAEHPLATKPLFPKSSTPAPAPVAPLESSIPSC